MQFLDNKKGKTKIIKKKQTKEESKDNFVTKLINYITI